MSHIVQIGEFIYQAFARIWPYLVLSIPFAVILRRSGLGEKLRGAFSARPVIAVFLATAAGAFGPFCSCSVIPIISSMLVAGIPLAPVMSFWIASPTMDPEIFFLTVSVLGWNLAVARLVATLAVSLSGGLLVLWLTRRGWLGKEVVRAVPSGRRYTTWALLRNGWARLTQWRAPARSPASGMDSGCGCGVATPPGPSVPSEEEGCGCPNSPQPPVAVCGCAGKPRFWRHVFSKGLGGEVLSVVGRVAKFMLLAFFLEALIKFYVPQEWIVSLIGTRNLFAPGLATLIGIPVYTGNLMAMSLVGGLLQQGMDPGAALSFLIAGPITTLPAMAAVWGSSTGASFSCISASD